MMTILLILFIPVSILVLLVPSYWLAGRLLKEKDLRMSAATLIAAALWAVCLAFYLEADLGLPESKAAGVGFSMFFVSAMLFVGGLGCLIELAVKLPGRRRRKIGR